jgi:beta-lactamase superfamily II metal-dependent hydrolase
VERYGSGKLRMQVLQAGFGDCLLIQCPAETGSRHILVDGGPTGTYRATLRSTLRRLAQRGGDVDLAVLSHIDNDHILGLLDYFGELARAKGRGRATLPEVRAIWHNSFSLAAGGRDVAPMARRILKQSRTAAPLRRLAGIVSGVAEGDALTALAGELGLHVNPRFANGQVLAEATKPVTLGEATIHVTGPSRPILNKLREEWLDWQRRHADAAANPRAAVAADRSVPNLSSITMLVEWKGRRLLLTGDARGDQIIEGLGAVGLMTDGTFHVSVLKMPHHGSARNASPAFLRTITADRYVFSANGRYGNPDLECLQWTVEAARESSRRVELIFTNPTPAHEQLVRSHPPRIYGYRSRILGTHRRAMSLTV